MEGFWRGGWQSRRCLRFRQHRRSAEIVTVQVPPVFRWPGWECGDPRAAGGVPVSAGWGWGASDQAMFRTIGYKTRGKGGTGIPDCVPGFRKQTGMSVSRASQARRPAPRGEIDGAGRRRRLTNHRRGRDLSSRCVTGLRSHSRLLDSDPPSCPADWSDHPSGGNLTIWTPRRPWGCAWPDPLRLVLQWPASL